MIEGNNGTLVTHSVEGDVLLEAGNAFSILGSFLLSLFDVLGQEPSEPN